MDFYSKSYTLPKKKITNRWLENNGFRYSKLLTEKEGGDVYIKRITVWRYGTAGTLEGEMQLNSSTGNIILACYDAGTRNIYASWYYREYGHNSMVEQIDKKFAEELSALGAKETNG